MARTDVHRPSAINPEEYNFIAFQYYGGSDLGAILAMKEQREILFAHMAATGGRFSGHEHGGVCHVCGQANISYAVVFYHHPSNSYIVTGETCATKMDMGFNQDGLTAFRKNISNALEARAGKAKAKATLEAAGLAGAWDIYTAENREGFKYEETTITDMVGKLVTYGSISDKAQNYMRSLLERIPGREQRESDRETQRKAEYEAAAPCPTGRVEISGQVIGTRVDETQFGNVTRILVKDDRGFKVWGNRTINVEKGERIRFVATITPSDNDPKFGFFKRPAKAVNLSDDRDALDQAIQLLDNTAYGIMGEIGAAGIHAAGVLYDAVQYLTHRELRGAGANVNKVLGE